MHICVCIKQVMRQAAINGTVYVHVNMNRFPRFICDALTINYFHTQNENCKYRSFHLRHINILVILANDKMQNIYNREQSL